MKVVNNIDGAFTPVITKVRFKSLLHIRGQSETLTSAAVRAVINVVKRTLLC